LLHRACEPILGAIRNDLGVESLASKVLLTVSHRAGLWWYTSLGPNSIRTWKQLEEQFHI
jgi:hypothetical protein